jgi:two-component system nitrogen regulation response regulator NtrX
LIDEISEIPLETQSKILRVLIDQKFRRINGDHDIRVDVRIICSTSKNIKKEVDLGNFREDLFHRLNVFDINIEPLKKRTGDISLLVKYFSKKIALNYHLKKLEIDTDNTYLINYSWPGNVRELRNLVERIAILSPESNHKISSIIKESLKIQNDEAPESKNLLSKPLKEARENFEKEYLSNQLRKFNGNISKTADFIGMERSALHRKLKGLGIKELN